METKPLKRHKALQPLSREHHLALLLCWKIRRGLELDIAPDRIGKYVTAMWHHQLGGHFDTEERFVFPILGLEHDLVKEAMQDHCYLQRMILNEPFTIETLNRIEERLEQHVRLEERFLFPLIQLAATEEQMAQVEEVHNDLMTEQKWGDQFWI